MPTYRLSAHFALLEAIADEERGERFNDLQQRLGDHTTPRVFGRYDDYVVSVVVEAETEKAAEELWFGEVDRGADESRLGHGHARYTTSLAIEELT